MTNCLKVQGEIMRAVTICQGQSYSSAFVWLHLSSLHNSIQSCGCWQRLTRSPPTHSLQLLWMEKHRRTAEDRQERKCSFYKKALVLMSFSTTWATVCLKYVYRNTPQANYVRIHIHKYLLSELQIYRSDSSQFTYQLITTLFTSRLFL